MPNKNQPQEFETFQLLFDENLATSESPMAPFKSFIEREQSFVNQILDYMHAPGKIGFFPHSFLGNAVALLSTRLNEQKINAKKIYYRFEESGLKNKKSELESIAITLKLVVATSKDGKKIDHIYPFIFTEDIKYHHEGQTYTDKFEFTKSEISSVIDLIKRDSNLSIQTLQGKHKGKFTLVEVLKNNYTLKIQKDEPKDNDIKSKEVYVYKKGDSLYFKAKNILNVIKSNKIKTGKENDELDINIETFKQHLNKKNRLEIKPKIRDFLSKKGYHCKKNNDGLQEPQPDGDDGFSATENNVTIRVYKKYVTDKQSTKEFKEITSRLECREIQRLYEIEKYTYLEDYIAKLPILRSNGFILKERFENVLSYVQQAHSSLRIDKHAYGSGAREANQHAFLAGIFQMDRYRDNTRIFIEQLAGRGLADTILLPLGPNRVPDSIPIVIEHKAGDQEVPSVALDQSEEYAKGLQTNRIRFLTTAENALCVGINLDYKTALIQELFNLIEGEKEGKRLVTIKSNAKKIINNHLKYDSLRHLKDNLDKIIDEYKADGDKVETKEKILGVLTFNSEIVNGGTYKVRPIIEDILNKIHEGTGSNHEIQKYIKEQLERTYYAFPGTRYGRSNHCFSRFLLGYSSSIGDSKYKKYTFCYDESGTTIETDTRPKKYNTNEHKDKSHAVTTVVFVSQKATGKVVIMNFIEGEDKAHEQFRKMKLTKDKLEKLSVGSKKIVEMNLFFDITKKNPGCRYSDFFKGLEGENRIIEHDNLVKYTEHHKDLSDFNGNFSDEIIIPKDFYEEIGRLLANPSTYKRFFEKTSEVMFPFRNLIKDEYDFQAVLDGIFGAYSDKKPNESTVLTEYQTGSGNRIDMIIQQKDKPIIGLELKISKSSAAVSTLQMAENQIKEKYEKSVNYKVLDDIDISKAELNKAELIGVVFLSDASSSDQLIKCSENINSIPITHSSITVLPGKDEDSTLLATSSSRPGSGKRERESFGTTQPDPKTHRTLTQGFAASGVDSQSSTSGGGRSRGAPYCDENLPSLFQSEQH